MKTYARIGDDDTVVEIIKIESDGDIATMFTAEFVETLVEVTGVDPMPCERWVYDGVDFTAPVAYQPSPGEIRIVNTSTRDYYLAIAALAIAPLQDAADLDIATEDESELLTLWKQHRVAVNRVDLTEINPVWPTSPLGT